jgi:hypothetical protein
MIDLFPRFNSPNIVSLPQLGRGFGVKEKDLLGGMASEKST